MGEAAPRLPGSLERAKRKGEELEMGISFLAITTEGVLALSLATWASSSRMAEVSVPKGVVRLGRFC